MSRLQRHESFTPRQLAAITRIVDHRLASERAAMRATVGDSVCNLRLAKTVSRDGTYPTTGDTFAIRFVDCGFTPVEPGSSTISCVDRTTEDDTNDADDVIAREINGQYVEEGTYVVALWQRGVEGDPADYGEWWIRLRSVDEGPCWQWSDDFDRADSTNVGADWNEVVGDWEIYNNRLLADGTANARLFCTQAVPRRSAGEMYIAIDVCDPQAGDVFFIYPSCPDTDSVGDVSVSFTFDGTSTWDIAISAGTGSGASEQTKTTPIDGKVGLYVCCDFTSGSVFAGVEGGISTDPDVGPAWADNASFTAGRYCAIGHNNAAGATFEDFFLYELRISATRLCLTCGCSCNGIVPSKTLVGTVTSGTDRAACLEGEDWEMHWSHGSGASYWEGDLVSTANTPTTTITYQLTCDGSDYDSTAWKAPGTVASGITFDPGVDDWNNPDYAKVDDDFNYTTADTKSGEPTKFLRCTNFGFTLPDDVTIVGVEVNIQRMASVAGDVEDYGVYLFNSDPSPVGDNKKDPDAWPGWMMEESVRYGASNDTWSRTLTKAIVEGAAFGVIIAAVGKSGTLRTAEIDYVEMKLYYKHRAGYNWKMAITNGTCCVSNPGGCSAVFRANAGSTCSPLSLNFGPFYLSRSDLGCWACEDPDAGDASGEYYITVTDPA